ncbi:hypothetical protein BH11ACT3_BH11ACT3_16480 [soil metagenome]
MAEISAPPGWYPDPSRESSQRWWSGVAWTEHTDQARPVDLVPAVPTRAAVTSSSDEVTAILATRTHVVSLEIKNYVAPLAFGIAVIGALVTIAGFVVPLPDYLRLIAGCGTGGFGLVAVRASSQLGSGMRMSVAAILIGAANIVASLTLDFGDLSLPTGIVSTLTP